MSKSLIFRIAIIALVWILMVRADFGFLLTLVAVGITFAVINLFLLVLRLIAGVASRFSR